MYAENVSWNGSGWVKIAAIDTGDGIDMYLAGTHIGYVRNSRTAYGNGSTGQKWVGLYAHNITMDARNFKTWRGLSVPW